MTIIFIILACICMAFGGLATNCAIIHCNKGKRVLIDSIFAIVFFTSGIFGFKMADAIHKDKIANTPSIVYKVYRVDMLDGPRGGFRQVWLERDGTYIWILVENPNDSHNFTPNQIVTFTPTEWDEYIKSIKEN